MPTAAMAPSAATHVTTRIRRVGVEACSHGRVRSPATNLAGIVASIAASSSGVGAGAATPARLWRVTAPAYEEFFQKVNAELRLGYKSYGRPFRSPWELSDDEGFRDYSSTHRIDEPEIEMHLRNATKVARVLAGRMAQGGKNPDLQADADKAGDAAKSSQYTGAAETIANQLIQVEKDVESLKTMVLESTEAADQAKAAVKQNSRLLQEKIAEKSKLLSQLEQAKMQEEMNSAMATLNETVGEDVPTLKEVQDKIEARYAKAKASSELNEASVESRVLEIEQATANVEAQGRLSQLRAELGLDSGAAGAPLEAPSPQETPLESPPA